MQAPTAAEAAKKVANAQTAARLQHSDAQDSYTEDGYGERTYTINAESEKGAAAKAVAEYRATHPAQVRRVYKP